MSTRRWKPLPLALSVLATLTVVAAVGWAKQPGKKSPDGTLKLEVRDLGAGLVGWTWGHGALTYKGTQHPFKVDGLVLDTVGMEREEGTGEVYNLGKVADFGGVYRAIEATAAAAQKGIGVTKLRNEKGVQITLHSTSKGFGATAGPEGVKITLEQ